MVILRYLLNFDAFEPRDSYRNELIFLSFFHVGPREGGKKGGPPFVYTRYRLLIGTQNMNSTEYLFYLLD